MMVEVPVEINDAATTSLVVIGECSALMQNIPVKNVPKFQGWGEGSVVVGVVFFVIFYVFVLLLALARLRFGHSSHNKSQTSQVLAYR